MTVQISACSYREYNKLASSITEFNLANLPANSSSKMQAIGYVLKDPKLGLIGGITGRVSLGNTLSIEILWVESEYRMQGYATKLLSTLESVARNLGSKLSQVDTFDFQALGFYEKNGYSLFGVLDDCPCVGNKRYYLKKVL